MNPIIDIAKKYNLYVVEGETRFGSKYNDKHGTIGNTGCFSFHPRKAITTGEGGMVTTNDTALAERFDQAGWCISGAKDIMAQVYFWLNILTQAIIIVDRHSSINR